MVAMELAEVVNPPFFFPVVGVVLCAVLVFAFGFKSPVQPPSFAFEDDGNKKSNKKQQKKAKKLQNGHVAGNELTNGSPSTASTPKQASARQSPGNKHPTVEKHDTSKPRKRPSATPKAASKADKTSAQELAKEQDAGEWTTALSRREKKMRGKKDDRQEKYVDDGWSDEPTTDVSPPTNTKPLDSATDLATEVGPGGDNAEGKKPMEQRNTKKDRKKRVGTGDQKPSDLPNMGKPVLTATSVATGASASSKATESVEEKQQEDETEPTVPPTKVKEESVDSTKVEESPDKKSPRKKKKKSSRLPEQIEATPTDVTEKSTHIEANDVVAETTVPDTAALIAEAMQESHDVELPETKSTAVMQQGEAATASTTDSKPSRSPKKKKKTKDREKEKTQTPGSPDLQTEETSHTEDLTESPVQTLDSQVASSTTSLSQSQPQTSEGAAAERLDAASNEETTSTAQAEGASSTPNPSTSSEDQSKVNFDELGDWQEAKPVKKKKKPRREN